MKNKNMDWKIVKNEEDLPQENELVLVCYKQNDGEIKYFEPTKWNKNDYPAKWFLVFKISKEFAWCKIESPII